MMARGAGRAAAVALALLAASAGCAGPAGPTVEYRADERLFTLFVALSRARFRDLPRDPAVEQHVSRAGAQPAEAEVASSLAAHPFHVAQYVHYVLSLSNPPSLAESELSEAPLAGLSLSGLDGVLRRFYQEADVRALWLDFSSRHEDEIRRLQRIVPHALARVDRSLAAGQTRKVIVIPALLDVPGCGYGVMMGDVGYLVIAPPAGDEQLAKLVEHEYMHIVVNPVCDANAALEAECGEAYSDRVASRVGDALSAEEVAFLWRALFREALVQVLSLHIEGTPAEERRPHLEALERQGCSFVHEMDTCVEKALAGGGPVEEMIPACLRCIGQGQEGGTGARSE